MRKFLLVPFLIVAFSIAMAQESETYKMPCSKLNKGGGCRPGILYQIDNASISAVDVGEMPIENFQIMQSEYYMDFNPKEIQGLIVIKELYSASIIHNANAISEEAFIL